MAGGSSVALLEVGIRFDPSSVQELDSAITEVYGSIKQKFDLLSSATWDEFKDYSRDTSKDVTKTWESTTKEMKNLTAKSLWGTVSAWFDDDMNQVETIWDNAWNSMIGSADKAWDGFLNMVRRRPQSSLLKRKGPEVFPGALAFG